MTGTPPGTPATEQEPDAGLEGGPDGGLEGGLEGRPDGGLEGGPDGGLEQEPDAGLDAGLEGAAMPEPEDERDRVRDPGELWRIEGSLEAVRHELVELEPLEDAALRERLAKLERRWRDELAEILPESVTDELHRYFDWLGTTPAGGSELRIGLAQLSGWLDGLISDLGVAIVEPGSP